MRSSPQIDGQGWTKGDEYERQLEVHGELDQEAVWLAAQLGHESETENHGLQRQHGRARASYFLDGGARSMSRADHGGLGIGAERTSRIQRCRRWGGALLTCCDEAPRSDCRVTRGR